MPRRNRALPSARIAAGKDIIPRDGKTLIRIDISTCQLAAGCFGGIMRGLGGGLTREFTGPTASRRLGVATAAAGLVATWAGVFGIARNAFSTVTHR